MPVTDLVTIIGNISQALIMFVTVLTLFLTVRQYRQDQFRQRAAQTREDLQAIIGDCNRFLRPLGESYPYPLLHAVTTIAREFRSRMGKSPGREDALALLSNEDLLLSISHEGWSGSSQIHQTMDIVETVERKASSRNLHGKLRLITNASFLLAGLVAKVYSPETFHELLRQVQLQSSEKDEIEDILNTITVELQRGTCQQFDARYKEVIKRSLYFILTAANVFINLTDQQLMRLAKEGERYAPLFPEPDPMKKTDPVYKIERESSLVNRLDRVKKLLGDLERDIHEDDYIDLCELIEPIRAVCLTWEAS
ncbi:MAG: hypothetical protein ACJ8CB_34655 [Ktedonobacteraceae bacterium]